jgi:wobble nucleotide-excising tRNase
MTIKNIAKLSDFGIFKNCNNTAVRDFGKYNLFYGWNGAGKSTLSGLFRSIERRSLHEKFPLGTFSITLEDGSTITQDNIDKCDLNVYTFNQDFVEENISWSSVAKSILLVDKKKIAEREKLEELKARQQTDVSNHSKEAQEIQKLEDVISKFSTNSARLMKTSLQSIDTTDNYFLNYDKRKFEALISGVVDTSKIDEALLAEKEVLELTNAAKPVQKNPININLQAISSEILEKAKNRLNELLQASVVSRTIQRLVENNDIKTWVETGISLYKRHDASKCEFCDNEITAERIAQLEAHFNDDYKSFQEKLTKAREWLAGQYIKENQLPSASELYDEFKAEYDSACTKLARAVECLNQEIELWHVALEEKISNQLLTTLTIESINSESIRLFTEATASIEAVVRKHNHKSNNFKQETTKAKKRLELHYASTEVKAFDLYEKKNTISSRGNENSRLNAVIQARKNEIQILEDSLSNESLGADEFNECLHKFLGRAELTLRFDPAKKGYEIIRNASEQVNGKLSEGEKTAIAFVYFVIKLGENANKIENTIVVVDDPVSSFDSNHLFHAYSFLRKNCNAAKQIFIFTHNFTYFKLVRDWFDGVNKNRKRKNPPREENAFFFTIEASASMPRQSTIKNAEASLSNYNSEYHYIFSKLHDYNSKPTLSRDEAFLTANLSRKLLESFFSFKFPKHRSDIAQLMDRGLQGCVITDESTKEKIYRFINKYSHSVAIEINEDSAENVAGESHNIVNDIFSWLKEVDEVHYNEMLEVVA